MFLEAILLLHTCERVFALSERKNLPKNMTWRHSKTSGKNFKENEKHLWPLQQRLKESRTPTDEHSWRGSNMLTTSSPSSTKQSTCIAAATYHLPPTTYSTNSRKTRNINISHWKTKLSRLTSSGTKRQGEAGRWTPDNLASQSAAPEVLPRSPSHTAG